jgi:hypothetical protein
MLKIISRSFTMRKYLILPLLLLLAACGSAAAPEATVAPQSPPANEPAVETEAPVADESNQSSKSDVVTGETPQDAGIVREQDHTKGAADPLVTIIEYGDFQ